MLLVSSFGIAFGIDFDRFQEHFLHFGRNFSGSRLSGILKYAFGKGNERATAVAASIAMICIDPVSSQK